MVASSLPTSSTVAGRHLRSTHWIVVAHVLTIVRICMLVLLTVDQGHPVDAVILVVGVLVSTHDQFLLGSLQTDRTHSFGAVTGNVYVRHVLRIVVWILLDAVRRMLSLIAHTWKHGLRGFRRIIHVHLLLLLILGGHAILGNLVLLHLVLILVLGLLLLVIVIGGKVVFGCVGGQALLDTALLHLPVSFLSLHSLLLTWRHGATVRLLLVVSLLRGWRLLAKTDALGGASLLLVRVCKGLGRFAVVVAGCCAILEFVLGILVCVVVLLA